MRKQLLILIGFVLAAGGVFAQSTTPPLGPIGTLQAGDFRALAVTVDGDRLLVADGQNMQVRIYDFTDPAKPAQMTTSDTSGTPVLLAGGESFGLVALTTSAETDGVEVVTPPIPGPHAQYAAGVYIDIDKNPIALALSPNNHWGLAISERGYTLMQINSPTDINSYEVGEALINGVLSNTTAYLLRGQNLEAATLDKLQAMTADQTLALNGVPSAIALNAAATTGAVVVDGNRLVFFDPVKLSKTGEFTVAGNPISGIHFLAKDANTEYLLVTQQGTNTIAVLNFADPQNVVALAALGPLNKSIRAMTVYKQYLIVTDGVTISIFTP